MKRTLAISLLLLVSICISPTAHASGVPASFTVKGAGFGHGVGLSQIGAKGQALSGKSAIEILNYYFPTSQVTPVIDTQTIRVNIGHQLSNVRISLTANKTNNQWNLQSGDSGTIYSGSKPINFAILGSQISAGALGISDTWTLRWNESTTTVVVPADSTTTTLAHGYVQLRVVAAPGLGYRIEVTNTLNLRDHYLWGVSEVSSSWPTAAMQAQAIASRTYALSRLASIKKSCDCHVYNHKFDQVYAGYSKEAEPRFGNLWKAAVSSTNVDTTTALAITYQGKPINVFFSSSTGGATATAKDVWGSDYPYLVSVPDPWSLDSKLNPKYNSWSITVSQRAMAQVFKLPDVLKFYVSARTSTSAALRVTAISSTNQRSTIPVSQFKVPLKIPSSWFNLPPTAVIPTPQIQNSETAAISN